MTALAGLIAEVRRAMRVSADAERLMHNTERLERAVAAFIERHRRVKDERDRLLADLAACRAENERLRATGQALLDVLARRSAEVTECRRVLEPLLARPFAPGSILCLFCRRQEGTFDDLGVMTGSHAPGCPVLRAEALLGREGERG